MYPNPTFYEQKYKILRYLNLKLRVELRALPALPCLYTSSKMATWENSNNQNRKGKVALTDFPIKYQATTIDGIIPNIPPGSWKPPPFAVSVLFCHPPNSLTKISFQQISITWFCGVQLMGKEVSNYKGLDRAVKHFEAGDISNCSCSSMQIYILDYKV